MRILSTILIFAMTYTFAHEAMCHEGRENTSPEWFSHAGPEHRHDEHASSDHNLPQESDHDSDHHDDDSHDHDFQILLVKKDLSTQGRILSNHSGIVASFSSCTTGLAVASGPCHISSQSTDPPLPGYLCAHVLRL
jgi:hypothetical protein